MPSQCEHMNDWLADDYAGALAMRSDGLNALRLGADVRPDWSPMTNAVRLSQDRRLLADQTGHGPCCGSGALRAKTRCGSRVGTMLTARIPCWRFCAGR